MPTSLAATLEETARIWGRLILSGFGAPAQLCAWPTLPRAEGMKLRALIAAFEIMVRQFVLALAQTITLSPARTLPKRTPHARTRPPLQQDAPSETWAGVSFRLAPPPRPARTSTHKATRPTPAIATLPLALRFEAAIRIVLDPTRAAQRMARRRARDPTLARRLVTARPSHAALATSRALTFFFDDRERRTLLAPLLDSS